MVDIFNIVLDFLKGISASFGANFLTFVLLFTLGILLITIAVQSIVVNFSLEAKTGRAIKKVEEYLQNNPFVTNENIVEFNRLMKRIPKTMRTKWQQYVVNRSKKPSEFFTEEDCIEKPFKTKGYNLAISQFKSALIVIAAFSFIFSLIGITTNVNIATALLNATLIPALLLIIGFIYIIIMKSKHNTIRAKMYDSFNNMTKLLDRAVTSFPDFVDYEILFTKKEIDLMIPELQEYLRQRAIYEQEQLEKAKQDEVEHENYDFSSLGVDGALVMERAMKECEFYLGNRRKTLTSIEQLQTEKDLLIKNYDEKNKVSQRKLRDINETLDRLREKLNNTTNKIVGNDIRRQQAEEIKKQQNIEREIEEDNNRYNDEVKKVDEQIAAKYEEISKNKNFVEVAFMNEFKAYSDKVYEEIYRLANEKVDSYVEQVNNENQLLKQQLEERDQFIVEKNVLFEEKVGSLSEASEKIENQENALREYEQYRQQADAYIAQKEQEVEQKNQEIIAIKTENESLKKSIEAQEKKYKELRKQKYKEITRYFDVNGNEFYYDEKGMPYFYDKNGAKVYYYQTGDADNGENGALVENYNEVPMIKVEEEEEFSFEQQPQENVNEVEVVEKPEEVVNEENLVDEEPQKQDEEKPLEENEEEFNFDFEVPAEEVPAEPVQEEQKVENDAEQERYFDDNGNEYFYDNRGIPYFYNENGEVQFYYTEEEIAEILGNQEPVEEVKEEVKEDNEFDFDFEVPQEEKPEQEQVVSEEKPEENVADDLSEVVVVQEVEEEPVKEEVINVDNNLDDLSDIEIVEEDEVQEAEEVVSKPEEVVEEEKVENPDAELEVLKAAIDAEIVKLEEEHNQLKEDMVNVAKEVEKEEEPKKSAKKSAPKKSATKKPTGKKTTKKAEPAKKQSAKKSEVKKAEEKKTEPKKANKKAEPKKEVKKAESKKSAPKKQVEKQPKQEPKKSATKKAAPKKEKAVKNEAVDVVDLDISAGFEDFNKQLQEISKSEKPKKSK